MACVLMCVAEMAGVTRQAGRSGKAAATTEHHVMSMPKSPVARAASGMSESISACTTRHASAAKMGVCISIHGTVVARQLMCAWRTRRKVWNVPCTIARMDGWSMVALVAPATLMSSASGMTLGCTATSQSKSQLRPRAAHSVRRESLG